MDSSHPWQATCPQKAPYHGENASITADVTLLVHWLKKVFCINHKAQSVTNVIAPLVANQPVLNRAFQIERAQMLATVRRDFRTGELDHFNYRGH
jgi:hypothetical protein